MQGLIHIYTGEGKGKTTAAMGLALRAAGQGLRVMIVQFLKGGESGETRALANLPGLILLRNSQDRGFLPAMGEDAREALIRENNQNLAAAIAWAGEGGDSLLVLDEAVAAYRHGALDCAMLDAFLADKPASLELVITGRDAPPHFLAAADYISQISCIRHPFSRGVAARKGVEY